MPGKHLELKDIGKHFQHMKAQLSADSRKETVIAEFRNNFIRQGFSYWMANNLALEKYSHIHAEHEATHQ